MALEMWNLLHLYEYGIVCFSECGGQVVCASFGNKFCHSNLHIIGIELKISHWGHEAFLAYYQHFLPAPKAYTRPVPKFEKHPLFAYFGQKMTPFQPKSLVLRPNKSRFFKQNTFSFSLYNASVTSHSRAPYGLFPGCFEQKSYVHSRGPHGPRAAPYEFGLPVRGP